MAEYIVVPPEKCTRQAMKGEQNLRGPCSVQTSKVSVLGRERLRARRAVYSILPRRAVLQLPLSALPGLQLSVPGKGLQTHVIIRVPGLLKSCAGCCKAVWKL